MLRIVIIDEDVVWTQLMSSVLLEKCSNCIKISVATNAIEGLILLQNQETDLVLVGEKFESTTGFDLIKCLYPKQINCILLQLKKIGKQLCERYNILDCIEKPNTRAEIEHFVGILRQCKIKKIEHKNIADIIGTNNEIQILCLNGKIIFLNDIIYFEADRVYCKIWLKSNECFYASKPLGHFEKLIPDSLFFRCHKSFIVSLSDIAEYSCTKNIITLKNGKSIKLSRKKISCLKKILKN